MLKCAKLATVAFWDAYLKGDPAARAYLADALAHFSNGGCARG
jgi:hypothetical protein